MPHNGFLCWWDSSQQVLRTHTVGGLSLAQKYHLFQPQTVGPLRPNAQKQLPQRMTGGMNETKYMCQDKLFQFRDSTHWIELSTVVWFYFMKIRCEKKTFNENLQTQQSVVEPDHFSTLPFLKCSRIGVLLKKNQFVSLMLKYKCSLSIFVIWTKMVICPYHLWKPTIHTCWTSGFT